jgi:transcriptional regulator with XRE-family HTH domain
MPRRSRPVASPTLAAAVRQHFGLTQAELAAFVGVSQQALAAVEAGRKQLGPGPDRRLQVLARQLPPPDGLGPPAPAFEGSAAPAATETPAPAAPTAAEAALAPLRARLARCQWLRTQLRFQLAQRRQPGQARHQRRRWAVGVLGPALAQPLPAPDWQAPGGPAQPLPPYPLATPDAARDSHWLQGLALRLAATAEPLPPAAAALARARLAGLEAEIKELTAAMAELSAATA